MTALYFLGTQCLGQSPAPRRNGGSHSIAYFCQSCGDIWARAVAPGGLHFDIEHTPCEAHTPQAVTSWGRVPGTLCIGSIASLSTMRWIAAIEFLPEPVLLREFHLLLKHHQRIQDVQNSNHDHAEQ